MKYNKVILENLQRTSLKRVRIKVDPISVSISTDLANCNGYEGFILAEDLDKAKVLVILPASDGQTSVMDIPSEYLEVLKQEYYQDKLDNFKLFVLASLDIAADDPIGQLITACENTEDIEAFLEERGLSREDITKLYKYYSMI